MSLYRVTSDKLEPVPETRFADVNMWERRDLQRLLHGDITPIGDDLMVIAEEFGDWEDSKRRIDLLCLSSDARLVVVEIKRTEDGGHMELQAIRYAAMVSSMTLDQVIHDHARARNGEEEKSRREILDFLQTGAEEVAELTGEVRIVLVSANFSKEVTTSVLWLNRQGLDIRCVRLRPYRAGHDVLVDATQIIPLPEAAEYEIKRRQLEREQRKAADSKSSVLVQFWSSLIERAVGRTPLLDGHPGGRSGIIYIPTVVPGGRFALRVTEHEARVLCFVSLKSDAERLREIVENLRLRQAEVESDFGGTLQWIFMDSQTDSSCDSRGIGNSRTRMARSSGPND